jgi:hypothetical protein
MATHQYDTTTRADDHLVLMNAEFATLAIDLRIAPCEDWTTGTDDDFGRDMVN